jgi:hypothetical protein
METLAKFIPNTDPTKPNKIISRTFGKLAHIDKAWKPPSDIQPPQAEEIWRVRIWRETRPGQNRGCFLVHPIHQILDDEISHLAVGMYEEERHTCGVVFIRPFNLDLNWIMPLDNKRYILERREAYALVVCLGGELWYPLNQD